MLNALLPKRHAPRWMVTVVDVSVSILALYTAALLRFEFRIPEAEWLIWKAFLPVFITARLAAFLLFSTSAGIIRHTGLEDVKRIAMCTSAVTVVFASANLIAAQMGNAPYWIPFSILGIEWILTTAIMVSSRWAVKWLYLQNKRHPGVKTQIAIYGAGEAGLLAKEAIDRELGESGMKLIAFIDDDRNKIGKKIEGVDILNAHQAEMLFADGRVDQMILSIQSLDKEKRRTMVDMALRHGVRPLDVPPVERWINGALSFGQIKELRIEDLLGREPIELNSHPILENMQGKRVVVTGAAGSIGSELVRQLLGYQPSVLLAIDQAETPMHDLHLELVQLGVEEMVDLQIGDVRDAEQILDTLQSFQPDVVFHAAAYKHVPMMEKQPWQAFDTNAMGSLNVLMAAEASGCPRFVFISTDKAVNPTSVMGATKRLAELLVLQRASTSKTQCVITRFGNVLGSNGSVIPLFKKQIEAGGPITVTDKEVTRYFMTIPEAVSLVLEAAVIGKQDDVFVFDMGQSIKIMDLAKKMIALAGMEEGKDIEVAITGLRPGEKMHEELLSNRESLLPTHHSKIMRANTPPSLKAEDLERIIALSQTKGAHPETLSLLHALIPEYSSSQNR